MRSSKGPLILKGLLFIALVSAAVWVALHYDMRALAASGLDRIRSFGPWAAAAYTVVFIAAPLLLFPFAVIAVAGGVLFGFVMGWGMISLACTVSAVFSFLLGRYFFRQMIHHLADKSGKYRAIDEAIRKEGWKIVALTRIIPLFPFGPLNMFLGSTKIPFLEYAWSTWFFMLPGCAFYAYVGGVGRDLFGGGMEGHTTFQWTFTAFTVATFLAAGLYAAYLGKKILRAKTHISDY